MINYFTLKTVVFVWPEEEILNLEEWYDDPFKRRLLA